MKKIFALFIVLLIASPLLAQGNINGGGSQGKNYVSKINSTTTLLGSSATFTGPWELCWDYSTVELTIKSDKNSATLGVRVQFSDDESAISNMTTFSYTANDTLTNTRLVPIAGSYVRVIYTNTNSAQTGKFNLSTRYFSKPILPLTSTGKLDVTDVLGATAANQTNGSAKTQVVNSGNANLFESSNPGLTKPYLYYINARDSVKGADTASYNFNNDYLKAYITIYNSHATLPDTLGLEHYSTAKPGWTSNAIGFRDVLTDYLEANNLSIIIPALTTKTFEVNFLRPGQVRVRFVNATGRTTARLDYVTFRAVN